MFQAIGERLVTDIKLYFIVAAFINGNYRMSVGTNQFQCLKVAIGEYEE